MKHELNSNLGREIRQDPQTAAYKLRSSGRYGLLCFILSFVEEGEGCDFFIENAAVEFCGEDIREEVYDAVAEGMNRYWTRDEGYLRPVSGAANDTASRVDSLDHGFAIIRAAQNLKLAFDEAGQQGLLSFAKACIWSGITEPKEIIARATAIAGPQYEDRLDTILMEGEHIHWCAYEGCGLELMTGAE